MTKRNKRKRRNFPSRVYSPSGNSQDPKAQQHFPNLNVVKSELVELEAPGMHVRFRLAKQVGDIADARSAIRPRRCTSTTHKDCKILEK